MQIKGPKQTFKIVVTETKRCNVDDFSEKIALHLDFKMVDALHWQYYSQKHLADIAD